MDSWLSDMCIEYIRQYRYVFNGENRFVDFYLPKYNLFIEVDGEYWHKDLKDIDSLKDSLALKDGIQTLRLSSSNNIIESLESYFSSL